MTDRPIQIKGGAGPYEAAAIVAVIQRVVDEQTAARVIRPRGNEPNAWVRAGRTVPAGHSGGGIAPGPGLNWPEL
jgi:hypothetical protein